MTRIEAGTRVKRGYYFSMMSRTFQLVPRDGEELPGTACDRYVRIPPPLAWIAVAILWAGLLIFAAFVGYYLAFTAVTRRALRCSVRGSPHAWSATCPSPAENRGGSR